ncbi:hypothetical protein H6P81_010721 [Aristolochia fimbriata]|uniref:Pentatricopeptide repeat-containing protein n=1 Tax=Aristolochia fimbriata TaxID=158543 RepID=A0AAV7EQP8_ARIFI|nr:hypothetical protein H6P81_010721 [Aristolochia fimbriata]
MHPPAFGNVRALLGPRRAPPERNFIKRTSQLTGKSLAAVPWISPAPKAKRFDEAINMLERLPLEGVNLNKASYRIVLNFLLKEGQLDMVMIVLCLMFERGFRPHFATSNELLINLCENGRIGDANMTLHELVKMGFVPELDSWMHLIEAVCRDRKLVKVFDLLDELVISYAYGNSKRSLLARTYKLGEVILTTFRAGSMFRTAGSSTVDNPNGKWTVVASPIWFVIQKATSDGSLLHW